MTLANRVAKCKNACFTEGGNIGYGTRGGGPGLAEPPSWIPGGVMLTWTPWGRVPFQGQTPQIGPKITGGCLELIDRRLLGSSTRVKSYGQNGSHLPYQIEQRAEYWEGSATARTLPKYGETLPNTALERDAHRQIRAPEWSTAAVTRSGCSVGGPCLGSVYSYAERCSDRGPEGSIYSRI